MTPELADPPARDVEGVLAACGQRVLEREGIAMFVALHDARPGRQLVVRDQWAGVEGARLAVLFDHYERGLADAVLEPQLSAVGVEGDRRPAGVDPGAGLTHDAAELMDVLMVLSDQHLRAGTQASR